MHITRIGVKKTTKIHENKKHMKIDYETVQIDNNSILRYIHNNNNFVYIHNL